MDRAAWRVEMTAHAKRDLRKLTRDVQEQIEEALEGLTTDPPTGDLRKLKGERDEFRLRVGVWRVIDRRDRASRRVVVLSVDHRREAYRAD